MIVLSLRSFIRLIDLLDLIKRDLLDENHFVLIVNPLSSLHTTTASSPHSPLLLLAAFTAVFLAAV